MIVRRTNSSPSELFHHGIKNQHWGVRNGPPYPLDRKVSARIKKGYNEKLRDKKKEGLSKYASAQGNSYEYPSDMSFEEAKSQGDIWKNNESHLQESVYFPKTNSWMNVLEDEGIASYIDSNMTNKDSVENKFVLSFQTKNQLRKNGFGNANNTMELLKMVNTDEARSKETMNNCSKCSDMVELIMHGLNPSMFSAGRTQFGMLSSAAEYHWDGAIPYKEKSLTNIENRIKSFGNHGSGTIGVCRADGSGHSMHFSRLSDGSIEVQDGQIGKTYSSIGEALSAEGHDFNQFCKITRLDCATPNVKHMAEDSVLRLDSYNARVKHLTPSVTRTNKDSNTAVTYFNNENRFTEFKRKDD